MNGRFIVRTEEAKEVRLMVGKVVVVTLVWGRVGCLTLLFAVISSSSSRRAVS